MNLRHPLAAVLGVAGLVVGSIAAMGGSASAAGDDLVSTTKYSCQVGTFTPYDWDGELTLSAVRPEASTTVTLSASLSKMAGAAPVDLIDAPISVQLTLDAAGSPVVLKGTGKINAPAKESFALPNTTGTLTSDAATLAMAVTSLEFSVTALGSTLQTTCTPTAGAAIGTIKVVTGTPPTPTPTPTPTTTTSATATPTAKPSASPTKPTGVSAGKPAKGSAAFACKMSIGSTFDYDADISISGFRAKAGDDVSLVAKMSDLPDISPVPIVGSMDYTLDAEVGGKKVTLKSTGNVNAAAYKEVPVTDLTGTVAVDGDELKVAVSAFTFDFPSAGIGAECTVARTALGTMTVGSEPIETDPGPTTAPTDAGGGGGGGGGTSSGGTLPQTGGGDSLPVVALWALALTLLGVAGLLCVPRGVRRQH